MGKRYHDEPDDNFREQIWTRGHFSALELFRLAAWKSAQGLASLTLNTEEAIACRTSAAMEVIAPWRETDVLRSEVDWRAWSDTASTAIGSKREHTGLLGLEGFGYPMASAFLSYLVPAAFPVIDRWAVKAVYGSSVAQSAGVWHRWLVYAHFGQQLVNRQGDFPDAPNIHRVDQAVMNRAMNCSHRERPCACFPYWPVDPPKAGATPAQGRRHCRLGHR